MNKGNLITIGVCAALTVAVGALIALFAVFHNFDWSWEQNALSFLVDDIEGRRLLIGDWLIGHSAEFAQYSFFCFIVRAFVYVVYMVLGFFASLLLIIPIFRHVIIIGIAVCGLVALAVYMIDDNRALAIYAAVMVVILVLDLVLVLIFGHLPWDELSDTFMQWLSAVWTFGWRLIIILLFWAFVSLFMSGN